MPPFGMGVQLLRSRILFGAAVVFRSSVFAEKRLESFGAFVDKGLGLTVR